MAAIAYTWDIQKSLFMCVPALYAALRWGLLTYFWTWKPPTHNWTFQNLWSQYIFNLANVWPIETPPSKLNSSKMYLYKCGSFNSIPQKLSCLHINRSNLTLIKINLFNTTIIIILCSAYLSNSFNLATKTCGCKGMPRL